MFVQKPKPDKSFQTVGGVSVEPLATLSDGENREQIVLEDGSYVVYARNGSGQYDYVCHISPEVLAVMRKLPLPT